MKLCDLTKVIPNFTYCIIKTTDKTGEARGYNQRALHNYFTPYTNYEVVKLSAIDINTIVIYVKEV